MVFRGFEDGGGEEGKLGLFFFFLVEEMVGFQKKQDIDLWKRSAGGNEVPNTHRRPSLRFRPRLLSPQSFPTSTFFHRVKNSLLARWVFLYWMGGGEMNVGLSKWTCAKKKAEYLLEASEVGEKKNSNRDFKKPPRGRFC